MTVVLLTGSTGFFGSKILEMLLKDNYSVIILKRSFSDTKRINNFIDKIKSYDTDKTPIARVFSENKIDIIIHAATNYGRNNEAISEIIKTNLLFPIEILECATNNHVKLFINTSTSLPDDLNYYEMTKKQFSKYAKKIIEDQNIIFLNIKMEHMYGPRESSDKFMPSIIRKILKNEKIDMTKGEQERDFIYIEDAVEAYSILLKNISMFKGFVEIEVGSGRPLKIKEVATTIKKVTGSESIINFGAIPYRKNEPMHSCADNSFLKKIGWIPKYDFETGIKKTVEYYREEMTK